jgi:hypothetical protein
MTLRLTTVHEKSLDSRFRGNDVWRHPRESGGPPLGSTAIFMAVAHARPLMGTQKP